MGQIPIPPDQVCYIKAVQREIEAAGRHSAAGVAHAYGERFTDLVAMVRGHGGAYVAHIGYGVNGHVAFNEPHVDKWTEDPVIPVTIDEASAMQQFDDYRNHPDPAARYLTVDVVPRNAVTVSMAGILDADHIICVVPGTQKADAVKGAVDGEISDGLPASMSRLARDFRLFLTTESASKLDRPPAPQRAESIAVGDVGHLESPAAPGTSALV